MTVRKEESDNQPKRLYRSETNKLIAGVAGGLGEYFGIDSNLIRLVFILLTIFGGSGVIIYLILWIILPTNSSTANGQETIKENASDFKKKTENFAQEIRVNYQSEDARFWWGIVIIVIGFLFLLNTLGIFNIFNFAKLWPVILILLGLLIVLRR